MDSTGKMVPLYDPLDAAGNVIPNSVDRPLLQCNGVLNVICPNRIDPTAKLLVAMLPHPDNPNLLTNNYRSRSYSTSNSALPSIKFDYIFNEKHRISYLYSHFQSPATPSINQFEGLPGTGFPSDSLTEYHRLNDDYVIKPNLLNHLTIGYNHRHIYEAPVVRQYLPVGPGQPDLSQRQSEPAGSGRFHRLRRRRRDLGQHRFHRFAPAHHGHQGAGRLDQGRATASSSAWNT